MINRWTILAVLFLARTTMAFQFQGAAARCRPFLIERYGVSLVEIGLLIGLYLAPGVVVALPGGAIAARFGEKRVVGCRWA
jgi:MFS family permease